MPIGNPSPPSSPLMQQTINGKQYQPYTPEWYNAMSADTQRRAKVGGQAQGNYAGEALKTLQGYVPGMFDPSTSTTTGAGAYGPGGAGGGGPIGYYGGAANGLPQGGVPPTAQLNMPSTAAAQAAEFNRAKDVVGNTSKAALTSLRSALGGRGMLGSGLESRGTANVINQGQQQLGDIVRQQAMTGSELANQAAMTGYQGGIEQRGQDISSQQAANALRAQLAEAQSNYGLSEQQLAEEQRQFNLNKRQQQYANVLAALGGLQYPAGVIY